MLHFCMAMYLAYVEEMACVVFEFFNATSLVVSKKMLTHKHTHIYILDAPTVYHFFFPLTIRARSVASHPLRKGMPHSTPSVFACPFPHINILKSYLHRFNI